MEQGPLGGNDLYLWKDSKEKIIMTIYIEYYRGKWEVMLDECRVPA